LQLLVSKYLKFEKMKDLDYIPFPILRKLTLQNSRKSLSLMFLLICFAMSVQVSAQIGVHTDTPDASSAMDIVATDRGLLIPRVTLTSDLTSPSPVSSPATGLMVFNTGANQPVGLYYWDGSSWVVAGGGASGDFWSLTGNSGTSISSDFLGTTDNEHFAIRTNDNERMRFESDGQIIVGDIAPADAGEMFTVFGNSTLDYAINAYSPGTGVYTEGNYSGLYSNGGKWGVLTLIDSAEGAAIYARNSDPVGHGLIVGGCGNNAFFGPAGHHAGLTSAGDDGIITMAKTTAGTGIVAVGNNLSSITTIPEGSGGAFKGYHGAIARGTNASGIGVIGSGNNITGFISIADGSGGSFQGFHGTFNKATDANGNGVIGLGSNGTQWSSLTEGSGGAFTGYHGIYARAFNTLGYGLVAVGNDYSSWATVPEGGGGAFTGFHGILAQGRGTDTGTGVIGAGNAGPWYIYDDGSGHQGSGGSFTGSYCGVAGFGHIEDAATIGVYGRYNGGGNVNGTGVFGVAITSHPGRGYGVIGQGNNYGVYANGDLGASGSKSFEIDHPLDPENKKLKHFCIESNEVLNMYRGVVVLDGAGNAEIALPEYFTAININFSYTLTAIGQQAPNIYISREIDDAGSFAISGGNPGQKISWVVYAERNDLYLQEYGYEVEVDKTEDERGKYIRPELYNQPEEKGIHYVKGYSQEATNTRGAVMNREVIELKGMESDVVPKEETRRK
jgi:hypothetical protein